MREQAGGEEKYLDEVFGLKDPLLADIKAKLVEHKAFHMSISPFEGRLLQFLIRTFQVKTVIEVGTLFGYSAICMARSLPDDGRVITLEKNSTAFALADKFFKRSDVDRKIERHCGDALETLKTLSSRAPFDMVFIDADKAAYLNYLDWAEVNVRKGGIIVGDNTFLFGAFWGEARERDVNEKKIGVMKEFNTRLSDPKKFNSILIPTTEGMTVAQVL